MTTPEPAEFAARAHAEKVVAATVERVAGLAGEPGRFAEWLSLHNAFSTEPARAVSTGDTFSQQASIMGIPAEVDWTVTEVGEGATTLRGEGPMGLILAFWLRVEPHQQGAAVSFDAGLDGQPINGPMGASVVRSLEEELTASLDTLAELVTGSGASRPRGSPVRHHPSATTLDPSTPVLVGAGQLVQREPDVDVPQDPAALSVRALREAGQDSGVGETLLEAADAVYAVSSASWVYRDQARAVADAVSATEARTVQSSRFGGDGPQLLINTAAQSIMDGEAGVVLVAGGEAGATLAAARAAGVSVDWPVQETDVEPDQTLGAEDAGNNDPETAVGLSAPIHTYPLLESAVRAETGRTPEQHRHAIGELWSRFSAVAAKNPYAWQPRECTPDQITTPSPDNRMVSAPYTKLMCANLQVDMASGLILCSAAAAEEAGVPQEKWVFIHAGASGTDEWFVSERAWPAASPAINTIGTAALNHAQLSINDITHVDLYSCFPSAVQIAAGELGLPTDDPDRPLTVTGGLTFGGGPGNNYGSHAVASLLPLLRADPETFGLSTSLGWYVTKHALGIYSATPPKQSFRHLRPVIDRPPSRPVRTDYTGSGVLEAATVPHDRDGTPQAGILSVLTPDGERVLVRSAQPEIITALLEEDPLRRPVTVTGAETVTIDSSVTVELPSPPPPPVLTRRQGSIMIITLNRPQARNAIDPATARALEHAVDAFEADPEARVAVLTGAEGFFSAGMDLKAAARGEYPVTERRGMLGITARPPVKPLIAAVEGQALAGGCELALAADLIVAGHDSRFGIPEPKRGLAAAAGGVLRLSERLPRNIAMELALTGDPMPATRLAELGLVNELAEAGAVLDAAIALAERIAGNAPLSVEVSKRIIDESPDWSTEEAFARQSDIAGKAVMSADAGEGVRAFNEKRDPVWKGR